MPAACTVWNCFIYKAPTSTVPAWSFTCAKARDARSVWCRCPRVCWRHCAAYFRRYRPTTWLFPGLIPGRPLTDGSLNRLCQEIVADSGLKKRVTMHTLRHPFAAASPGSGCRCCHHPSRAGSHQSENDGSLPARQHATLAATAEPPGTAPAAHSDLDVHRPGDKGGSSMTTTTTERPAWEVTDVIRQHGAAFLAKHGGWLTNARRQALHNLARCRTAVLGGHVEHCLDCGHQRLAYNSCRNRPLSQMPGTGTGALAASRDRASAAGRLLSPGLYPAGRSRRLGVGESAAVVRPAVADGGSHTPERGCRSQMARCGRGTAAGAARLGAKPASPSACAWHCHGRRSLLRRPWSRAGVAVLARLPPGVLPAGTRAQPSVSRQIPAVAPSRF